VRRDAERLADIVEATEKIAARVRKGREVFNADEDMQIVLVHLIQIIGEAAAGVSEDLIVAHPEVPWRQIIAMRNRVVHGYFEVDLNILWDVAIGDLPPLLDQIQAILAELTPAPDGEPPADTPPGTDAS
jgi:uncharacterized protein with HEPN domain